LSLVAIGTACSDDTEFGGAADVGSPDVSEVCDEAATGCGEWRIEGPRATPAEECPSGETFEGVCWPSLPVLSRWPCPTGRVAWAPGVEPVALPELDLVELCEPRKPLLVGGRLAARIEADDGVVWHNFIGINAMLAPVELASSFRGVLALNNEIDRGLFVIPLPQANDLLKAGR
jgi:hypothetical protein